MLDQWNLTVIEPDNDGKVNEVYISNDSILKVKDTGGIYGENGISDGVVSGIDTQYGAFSVEFSTNSKVIVFGTSVATMIFVDEGEGYRSTDEDGLNKEMIAAGGYDKYWKMTFSEKRDRNIKFEISKCGHWGKVYIEKDARIMKVQRENVKKVMFIGDLNAFLVKLHITKGIDHTFTAYPFGICDSLNLSCIANESESGGDLYVTDRCKAYFYGRFTVCK